jgi:hypothetical protein
VNHAQRLLVIATLVVIGLVLAFVFLNWGEGASSSLGGDRIAILVLREDRNSVFGSGYGLYTTKGIPGVILGLVAPLCLLAAAAFVALGVRPSK